MRPNEPYLAACDRFVDHLTDPTQGHAFLVSFLPAAEQIAELGARVSLAQTVVKLTSPGIPDIYQGCETWDFSLVDPDNRRPVDFALRRRLPRETARSGPARLLADWRTGCIKTFVIHALLTWRQTSSQLFSHGEYHALTVKGSGEVIAYARSDANDSIIVIVPRCFRHPTARDGVSAPRVTLPVNARGYRDLFTGQGFRGGEPLLIADLFAILPFAVLYART